MMTPPTIVREISPVSMTTEGANKGYGIDPSESVHYTAVVDNMTSTEAEIAPTQWTVVFPIPAQPTADVKTASDPYHNRQGTLEDGVILNKAFAITYRLQSLAEGWNGYDALPPSPHVVKRAITWFGKFYQACKDVKQPWFWPNIGASAEGEIAFEWWSDDAILTIDIEEDEITYMKFGRGDSTFREHGEANDPSEAVSLMRWFGEN